jgi:hypothetical protein
MSSFQMKLTCDTVTLDQFIIELEKLRFAGWGKSQVYFGGNSSIEMTARKVFLQDATDVDAPQKPTKS